MFLQKFYCLQQATMRRGGEMQTASTATTTGPKPNRTVTKCPWPGPRGPSSDYMVPNGPSSIRT